MDFFISSISRVENLFISRLKCVSFHNFYAVFEYYKYITVKTFCLLAQIAMNQLVHVYFS